MCMCICSVFLNYCFRKKTPHICTNKQDIDVFGQNHIFERMFFVDDKVSYSSVILLDMVTLNNEYRFSLFY